MSGNHSARQADELRESIHQTALRLHAALRATDHQLVLAESCTGGLIAASLAELAGISEVFCGSLVTYQTPIKTDWLNIPAALIERHNVVSQQVADAMAQAALANTPRATLSASITGHLGPAEDPREGLAFIALADRDQIVVQYRHQLAHYASDQRHLRQLEATRTALSLLLSHLCP